MRTGDKVRVVRSDGTVENDWEFVCEFLRNGHPRITVRKWSSEFGDFMLKAPSKELFDYWQVGGMAASTGEMQQAMQAAQDAQDEAIMEGGDG